MLYVYNSCYLTLIFPASCLASIITKVVTHDGDAGMKARGTK